MIQETQLEPARLEPNSFRAAIGAPALSLPSLILSLPLIALGATLVCSLLAVALVSVLYVRLGLDGLADVYGEFRFDPQLRTEVGAALVSGFYIGIAVSTLAFARWRGKRTWPAHVALEPVGGSWRIAGTLCFATLAYSAAATLAMTFSQANRIVVSGPTNVALLTLFIVNLVVLAPIAEEIFFRGWLYTGLRRQLSFWPSYLLTALFFAAIHWDAHHRRILLVLPLAFALGALREVAGSIKPTIALHAAYNLVIVSITLLET